MHVHAMIIGHLTIDRGMPREKPAREDKYIRIRLARRGDAATVSAITDAAYSKRVPLIGRKPEPMTADYTEIIETYPIHILSVEGKPTAARATPSSRRTSHSTGGSATRKRSASRSEAPRSSI